MKTKMRQERMKKGWTLEYVAIKVNTTKQTIQRIETMKRSPSYEVLVKLENLFNLSHRELFEQLPNENIVTENIDKVHTKSKNKN